MILKDTVVHDVDIVRWLLGHEFVRATVFNPRPSSNASDGLRDPLVIVFETEAGGLVTVEAFVNARYGYDIVCEVVGESGVLSLPRPQRDPHGLPGALRRGLRGGAPELDRLAGAGHSAGGRERLGRLRGGGGV